jgi:hypothetical protein
MTTLLAIIAIVAFVLFVFPNLSRSWRVGIMALFTLLQIIQGDALFAALGGAVTVVEWYDE